VKDLQGILKDLEAKYPLRMGRYLTRAEREDIRRLVPDSNPDWSDWSPVVSDEGWRLVRELGPLLTETLKRYG